MWGTGQDFALVMILIVIIGAIILAALIKRR